MGKVDLKELHRLAMAASPGPWQARPLPFDDWGDVRGDGGVIVAHARGAYLSVEGAAAHRAAGTDPYAANRDYIAAANPQAVLQILDAIDFLVVRCDRLESLEKLWFDKQEKDERAYVIRGDRDGD